MPQPFPLTFDLTSHIETLSALNAEIGKPPASLNNQIQHLQTRLAEVLREHLGEAQEERDELMKECEEMEEEVRRWRDKIAEYKEENSRSREFEGGLKGKLEGLRGEYQEIYEVYQQRIDTVKERYGEIEWFRSALEGFVSVPPLEEENVSVSLKTMTLLQEEIMKCENEFARRMEHVDNLVAEILNIWSELGITAESDHDKLILEHQRGAWQKSAILATEGNMKRLELKKTMLENQKNEVVNILTEMASEISWLWDKLQYPQETRDEFLNTNRGLTSDVVNAHETHLHELRELKKEHIEVFVQSARHKLKGLWDELMFSEEERRSFAPAFCSNYTDESLAAHESEIERLKIQVKEIQPLLEKMNRHRELVTEWNELEGAAKDSSRLLQKGKRDPGRLLREEKFRKRFAKETPKLEAELELLLGEWELRNKRAFTVYGKSYLKTMQDYKKVEKDKACTHTPSISATPVTKKPAQILVESNRSSAKTMTSGNRSPVKTMMISGNRSPTKVASSTPRSTSTLRTSNITRSSPITGSMTSASPGNRKLLSIVSQSSFALSSGSPRAPSSLQAAKTPLTPSASPNSNLVQKLATKVTTPRSGIPMVAKTSKNLMEGVPASAIRQTPRGARRKSNSFSGGTPNTPARLAVGHSASPARIAVEKIAPKEYHGSTPTAEERSLDEHRALVAASFMPESMEGKQKQEGSLIVEQHRKLPESSPSTSTFSTVSTSSSLFDVTSGTSSVSSFGTAQLTAEEANSATRPMQHRLIGSSRKVQMLTTLEQIEDKRKNKQVDMAEYMRRPVGSQKQSFGSHFDIDPSEATMPAWIPWPKPSFRTDQDPDSSYSVESVDGEILAEDDPFGDDSTSDLDGGDEYSGDESGKYGRERSEADESASDMNDH